MYSLSLETYGMITVIEFKNCMCNVLAKELRLYSLYQVFNFNRLDGKVLSVCNKLKSPNLLAFDAISLFYLFGFHLYFNFPAVQLDENVTF